MSPGQDAFCFAKTIVTRESYLGATRSAGANGREKKDKETDTKEEAMEERPTYHARSR